MNNIMHLISFELNYDLLAKNSSQTRNGVFNSTFWLEIEWLLRITTLFSVYIGTVFKETFIIQACQTHLLPNSCSALIINAAKVITLQQEITNTTTPIEK